MHERPHSTADIALTAGLVLVTLMVVPHRCLAQDTTADPAAPAPAQATAVPPTANDEPKAGFFTDSLHSVIDTFKKTNQEKRGWYLEASNMITGAGWISLGPGYRKHFFDDQAFADVSAATSWHLYKMVQGRFEAPDLTKRHVTLGVQTMWQDNTQVRYFGVGEHSQEDDESMYRMRSTDVVGYGSFRPASSVTIGGEFGWLHSPNLSAPAGTFKPSLPSTFEQFPFDPGVTPANQPSYFHSEISATGDTRDYPGHPTHGGLYRVAMTSYHDQRSNTFSFRQYEAEAARFAQVTGPNWVIVLHGWFLSSDVPASHDVPFYLLPSLGGSHTVRSFSSYRFHDRNTVLLNVESRWTLFRYVDAAIFADAGNVARVAADLNLDKTALGAGVRLHASHTTFARFDVAHGAEGWHFLVRTTDPFRFSRTKRRVANLPFAP